VLEYVLERGAGYDLGANRGESPAITPEDQVEFALRLGMDAVACHFDWQSNSQSSAELDTPPSLAGQLSALEQYLRAVQGTGVGVIASFRSFMDSALFIDGDPRATEERMEIVLRWQARVMRMVCGRFADDLALVLIRDEVQGMPRMTGTPGMSASSETPWVHYSDRMRRLIAPAKEHGTLVALQSNGHLDGMLQQLLDIGFAAVHPSAHTFEDLLAMRQRWRGKLALMGNLPTETLASGAAAEIEEAVHLACSQLGPGGGYVLSSSAGITPAVPPESFVAMAKAAHRYGQLTSVDQDV
jgi:uroporphyrinogen decarboxylase